jgi:hypothetical protein
MSHFPNNSCKKARISAKIANFAAPNGDGIEYDAHHVQSN